jgi:hypothetical protein
LSAILLVLFVERLGGDVPDDDQQTALGLSMPELYELIQDIVARKSLSYEELSDALIEVDEDGSATCLSGRHEFLSALFAHSGGGAGTERGSGGTHDGDHIGGTSTRLLVSGLYRLRFLLMILPSLAIATFNCWQGSLQTMNLWPAWAGRTTFACFFLIVCVLFFMVVFPQEVTMNRHSLFSPKTIVSTTTLTALFSSSSTYYHQRHAAGALVILVFCVAILLNGLVCIVRLQLGTQTWRSFRGLLAVDGLLCCSAALTLRTIDLTVSYPPGCATPHTPRHTLPHTPSHDTRCCTRHCTRHYAPHLC